MTMGMYRYWKQEDPVKTKLTDWYRGIVRPTNQPTYRS